MRVVNAAQNRTDKIHQHNVGAAATDLETEKERPARIERIGNQRLADLAPKGVEAQQDAIGL